MPTRPKAEPCRCPAYKFPHRPYSGSCTGGHVCTCTRPRAGPTDIEPPEPRRSRECPIHGEFGYDKD